MLTNFRNIKFPIISYFYTFYKFEITSEVTDKNNKTIKKQEFFVYVFVRNMNFIIKKK